MFKCPLCDFTDYGYGEVVEHFRQVHPGEELTSVYSISEEQYKALQERINEFRKMEENSSPRINREGLLMEENQRFKSLLAIIKEMDPVLLQTAIDYLPEDKPTAFQQYIEQAKKVKSQLP